VKSTLNLKGSARQKKTMAGIVSGSPSDTMIEAVAPQAAVAVHVASGTSFGALFTAFGVSLAGVSTEGPQAKAWFWLTGSRLATQCDLTSPRVHSPPQGRTRSGPRRETGAAVSSFGRRC
jgi:hypothetical protein